MQNNISFQGKTNLVLSDAYYLKKAAHAKMAYRSDVSDAVKFIRHNSYGIDTNGEEIVVLVNNDKSGIIRRFKPRANLHEMLLSLEDKIDALKKISNKKLTAWIIGGKANDNKTINAVNDVADLLCDRADTDASILAGIKNNNADRLVLCAKIGDTDVVFPKLDGVKKIEDLENAFDIVELNNVETKFD